MNCPLCGQSLRGHGPTMYSIWAEMESDIEKPVIVHVACAWDAVRNELYRREERDFENNPSTKPWEWIGWEPVDQESPYKQMLKVQL